MPKFEIIGTFIGTFITTLRADTEDEARRIILENLDYIGIDPKQTVLITREVQESDE